jgi:hypothetical protein
VKAAQEGLQAGFDALAPGPWGRRVLVFQF